MKELNYIEVPTAHEEDINAGLTAWKDGKMISMDEGSFKTLFIGHKTEVRTDEDGEKTVTLAFPVRVEKPVTRDKVINAAEMAAYDLTSAMDVASFTASLARKSRENEDNEEVSEHDDFIAWVKEELNGIGLI